MITMETWLGSDQLGSDRLTRAHLTYCMHMRMPKRGFTNRNRLDFAEVNLWRLEQAIAAGKLDAEGTIAAAVLIKAGVIRREKDGVKLLGKGELTTKLTLSVYSATNAARTAVEKAGGTLTTTKPEAAAEDASA